MIPNPNPGLTCCAACHQWRQPEQLVEVERLATRRRRFVCRYRECFRLAIGPGSVDRIVPTQEAGS